VLRHCYCVVRVWNGKNHSNPLLSKLCDLPRRVCYDSLIVWCVRVKQKKKIFKSLAQQTTRFSAPRSMLRGVRCPNTKILHKSVRCLVCSLSELFVNQSPTVLTFQPSEIGSHVAKSIFRLFQETNHTSHNHIFFNSTARPYNFPIYPTLKILCMKYH